MAAAAAAARKPLPLLQAAGPGARRHGPHVVVIGRVVGTVCVLRGRLLREALPAHVPARGVVRVVVVAGVAAVVAAKGDLELLRQVDAAGLLRLRLGQLRLLLRMVVRTAGSSSTLRRLRLRLRQLGQLRPRIARGVVVFVLPKGSRHGAADSGYVVAANQWFNSIDGLQYVQYLQQPDNG